MFYSDAPRTLEEAQKYRYNKWGGNPKGNEFDQTQCAAEAYDSISRLYYQCSRKPGHGPANLYCKQHAKKIKED